MSTPQSIASPTPRPTRGQPRGQRQTVRQTANSRITIATSERASEKKGKGGKIWTAREQVARWSKIEPSRATLDWRSIKYQIKSNPLATPLNVSHVTVIVGMAKRDRLRKERASSDTFLELSGPTLTLTLSTLLFSFFDYFWIPCELDPKSKKLNRSGERRIIRMA